MPSTHLSLHYHIVFSTKDRARIISRRWMKDLHGYLGGIITNLGGVPESIGGVEDHVHLLIGLRATHCLADVVRDIKANSSRWANDAAREKGFQWQEGYGAFTVSAILKEKAHRYILKQDEHHRVRSFQEEYVELLQKGMVEYDERYLW
jgi:putative transposase